MKHSVRIFEVGPRDGLQNEPGIISTKNKIKLIDKLSECGYKRIEATSFVAPKWVPQMADAEAVMAGIKRHPKTKYTALTPNLQGLERALKAKVDEIAIFAAASETFSYKNINCTIEESLARFDLVLKQATHFKIPIRGYVSCVVACPYEGKINPSNVAKLAQKLIEMGCYEISLGDTIGVGQPNDIARMLDIVCKYVAPSHLAGHFHDTKKYALNNIRRALDYGLRVFDSSIAGLGGCPYAPGASGNVNTTAVVEMLHKEGFSTGIDINKLKTVEQFAKTLI
ncbi:MAG: hydroxymethylglutaryl-CoA lyase [Pseudomonadota bacterium]